MLENNHYVALKTYKLKLNSIQRKIQSKFNRSEKGKPSLPHYVQYHTVGIFLLLTLLSLLFPQALIVLKVDVSRIHSSKPT